MAIVDFGIRGTHALLMHGTGGMKPVETRPTATRGGKHIPSPAEEAEAGAYRLPSRQLYLPSDAFRSALIDGASGFMMKLPGKSRAQSVSKLISVCAFTIDETCPLIDPDTGSALTEYVIDTRRAVVQGAGIMRSRPRIEQWATTVSLEYDPSQINVQALHEYMTLAGKIVGVGDYRPRPPQWAKGRGGPYGRFAVELLADR